MEKESLQSRMLRYGFNLFPPFRASGARLIYISPDFRQVKMALPLKRKTRNYVGTMYGGSMYSSIDGIYMVMLIRSLGDAYLVWDKSATIRYKKPAKETLYAEFFLSDDELDTIKNALLREDKIERDYLIPLTSQSGTVHAEITKNIQIRKKRA